MVTVLSPEERRLRAEEKAQKTKEIRNSLQKRSLSPKRTIATGALIVIICIAIVLVALIFTELAVTWNIFNWFTSIGLATLTTYSVYLRNFHQIDVGHKGVLLSFGERTQKSKDSKDRNMYNEGYIWTLPSPLQDLIIIDLREQNEKIDDKVIIAAGVNEAGEKEQAEMLVNSAIQWMVKDPFTFLDVGEDEVVDGLRTAVVNAIREVASNTPPLEFLQMKEELGDAVDQAAASQADRWGIEILNVNIPYIRFANPETAKAFEQAAIEARQKEAETIETDNLIKNAQALKRLGLNARDAVWAFQRERGKVTGKEVHFSGNKTSDFLAGFSLGTGKDEK